MVIDKLQILGIYKAEADELVLKLQNGFIELEKNPANPELVHELNRYAHTIKGGAAMMGFTDIQNEAHEIEDTFAAIGRNELQYTKEVSNKVYAKLDRIMELLSKNITLSQSSPQCSMNEGTEAASVRTVEEFIKVPIKRIDELVNLVGETIVSKSKAAYKASGTKKLTGLIRDHFKRISLLSEKLHSPELHQLALDADRIKQGITELGESVEAETNQLDPLIGEMQNKAREMRMLPASTIFDNYPRIIRDIAAAQNKIVEFVVDGECTEMDKKIIEAINPALIHLLRNAVDHGVREKGRISLSAKHEGGSIIIEVED